MKGKIEAINKESVKMKDGTAKDKYTLTFENDSKQYECWHLGDAAVGKEVEGEVTERSYNGKIYYGIKIKSDSPSPSAALYRGLQASRPLLESFAAAYSKDIVVAMIEKGIISDSEAVENNLKYLFPIFLDLMANKGGA